MGNEQMSEIKHSISAIQKELTKINQKERNPPKGRPQNGALDKPMTPQEKQALGMNIRSLSPEQLRGIIDIMRDSCKEQSETLEFDIDTLPPRKCRELERYVKKCLD